MAKRGGGLGRGLSSLLGGSYEEVKDYNTPETAGNTGAATTSEAIAAPTRVLVNSDGSETPESGTVELVQAEHEPSNSGNNTLEVDKIVPNPDQPRNSFDQTKLKELAASITRDGLLQPILVRPTQEGTYQIIAGERRWQASKLAGLREVPVRIIDPSDDKVLELAMVENLQRADLNPIEEAYGYRRMIERQGMTQQEVADAVSKGRSTIANALRLLDLPEQAQQALFEEQITAGHARAILAAPTEDERQKLTDKIIKEHLSVREAEAISRLYSGKANASATARTPLPKSYKKVARALRTTFGTNVKVKTAGGKNKIEIEFKDEEDLKRIFGQIMNENK